MAPLSTEEIQQISISIQEILSNTPYACLSLSRLTGGSASFTFRGLLKTPLILPNNKVITTIVLKKATEFAAINKDFPLDSGRSTYECVMLKALDEVQLVSTSGAAPVSSPKTFFYDERFRVQVIEDLQPANDLASVLTARAKTNLLVSDCTIYGFTLGKWLRSFYDWTQGSAQLELRRTISRNESSLDLKWRTTYKTICSIAKNFGNVSEEDESVLNEVRLRALRETQQQTALDPDKPDIEDQVNWGLIHGDFWTGNILASTTSTQLYVIDWEFSHIGHRATDLGQMVGDLLEKSHTFDSAHLYCKMMIEALVKGYGYINSDLAYRIVIHAGVHMINWCSRHPGADLNGKVEALMQRAVEMIVKAWRKEIQWFRGDILRCLFPDIGATVSKKR